MDVQLQELIDKIKSEGIKTAEELMHILGINQEQLICEAYIDLLKKNIE